MMTRNVSTNQQLLILRRDDLDQDDGDYGDCDDADDDVDDCVDDDDDC